MRKAVIGSVFTFAIVAILFGISWPTRTAEGQVAISPLVRFEESLLVGLGFGGTVAGPGRIATTAAGGTLYGVGTGNALVDVTIQNIGNTTITIVEAGTSGPLDPGFVVAPGQAAARRINVDGDNRLDWSQSGGTTAQFLFAVRGQ